jgi:hypothetical protein
MYIVGLFSIPCSDSSEFPSCQTPSSDMRMPKISFYLQFFPLLSLTKLLAASLCSSPTLATLSRRQAE